MMGAVVLAMAAPARGDVRLSFDPYKVILARRPFGAPPAVPTGDPVPAPPSREKSFVKDLRMCAIQETGAGLRVGLVDIKQNRSYFLRVGESEDGIDLVEADFQREGALLRRGMEQYWIYMDDSLPEQPTASGLPAGARSVGGRSPSPDRPAGGRDASMERLKKRQRELEEEERSREKAEEQTLRGEDLEDHLQAYQMEVIRQGLVPLPIPLTEEMDDQLVAEGVLPPADEEEGE